MGALSCVFDGTSTNKKLSFLSFLYIINSWYELAYELVPEAYQQNFHNSKKKDVCGTQFQWTFY